MSSPSPPAGAPWDAPFAQCPFALFDLEMTGPDPERDAIVEIAIARVVDGVVVASLDTLVRTDVPSQPEALAVHGITADDLKAAPTFDALAGTVAGLLSGAVLVAHGLALDLPFLQRALDAAGMPTRVDLAVDTVTLARRALHVRSYALSNLAAHLGLGPHRWHRAGEDVRALRALFAHLTAALAPTTARDLWEIRAGQRNAGVTLVRTTVLRTVAALERTQEIATLVVRTPGREPVVLRGRVRGVGRYALVTLHDGTLRSVRTDRILRIDPWR